MGKKWKGGGKYGACICSQLSYKARTAGHMPGAERALQTGRVIVTENAISSVNEKSEKDVQHLNCFSRRVFGKYCYFSYVDLICCFVSSGPRGRGDGGFLFMWEFCLLL